MNIILGGAAGFIGSNLAREFVKSGHCVLGLDNLSRGNRTNITDILDSPLFHFAEVDISHEAELHAAMKLFHQTHPIDEVWHLAANSDIPAGVNSASVDLQHTLMTTYALLEVMKKLQLKKLAFASSSAIYGEHPTALHEDMGPLLPISNYGAMKLASEALISAAVESYLERAWIFRFPNVIGVPATHGVILDLIQKLKTNNKELTVLGNGSQQKPYLHVSELIDAMRFITVNAQERLNYFNIGASDDGVTVKQIAEEVAACVAPQTKIVYGTENRGWIGDVPKFSYSIDKLSRLGWQPSLSSKQALQKAVREIAQQELIIA